MKGIWVVETTFDYGAQIAAYPTRQEAEKAAKIFSKKYNRECWAEYYKFGQIFDRS